MSDRLTKNARQILDSASDEATLARATGINSTHVLQALVKLEEGTALQALQALSVDMESLKNELASLRDSTGNPTSTRQVVEDAKAQADAAGDGQVGSAHLLLAVAGEVRGDLGLLLAKHGINTTAVHRALTAVRKPHSQAPGAAKLPSSPALPRVPARPAAAPAPMPMTHASAIQGDPVTLESHASATPKAAQPLRPASPNPMPNPAPSYVPASVAGAPTPAIASVGASLPGEPGEEAGVMGAPVISSLAAETVGAYAHARRVGNLLFLAGIGPRKRGTKQIPGVTLDASGNARDYDIEAQVRSCFENVRLILEEAGSSWYNIVDVTVFLTDMKRDFAVFNRLWAEFFKNVQPCRTTVEVRALPTPINVELKVIAAIT